MTGTYDFKITEKQWQDAWEAWKIYHFDFVSSKPIYSIDNPPRYASGALHLGHVTGYTIIDFAARYKRMRGFNVFFPLCFDPNGMPIEVAVEKKYGVNMRTTSRQRLVKLCEEFANSNIVVMTQQFKQLGISMDPSIYYQTDADYYRRITQISFLRLYKKNLVYKKTHPVLWCPSCRTALASADVEYEPRKTKLVYVKFAVEDTEKEVVIATTRPELLCTCQLVAVHPEDSINKWLVGKKVRTPLFNRTVPVVADENVDRSFGTGIVMICTIGDKDDLRWIYKYGLKIEKGIDEDGRMTALAGRYKGLYVSDAKERIITDLTAVGLIVRTDELDQNVGRCWRCHTPVEFLNVPQWFLKTLDFRDAILKMVDEIRWYPEFMKVRLQNWTNSLSWDWCLSRQRYFATPIPVWECQSCGEVVPATEEMCYCDPTVNLPPVSNCPRCSSTELKGCDDVFDTWMDSSITPLFNAYWTRDEEKFRRFYPMSLRPQSHDILRNWAFYTILRSLLLTGMRPWNDILLHGFIMAPDGTPMHTSRGNIIDPMPLLERYGADALRYYATTCSLGLDHAFQVKEVVHGRKLCTKLWNIARFIGKTIEKRYTKEELSELELQLVDKWILSRCSALIQRATEYIESYEFDKAVRLIENFTWHEVADFYVEMVKHRIEDKSDRAVRATLYLLGLSIIKLFAPFLCHLAEELYQRYYRAFEEDKSIHISAWPSPILRDSDAERKGELLTRIIAEIWAYKSRHNIPHNRVLESVVLSSPEIDQLAGTEELIARTVRAKHCVLSCTKSMETRITAIEPIYSTFGPKFRHHAKEVLEFIRNCDMQTVGSAILQGGYEAKFSFGDVKLTTEFLAVKKEDISGAQTALRVDDIAIIIK